MKEFYEIGSGQTDGIVYLMVIPYIGRIYLDI
jgi:hypothetical protein